MATPTGVQAPVRRRVRELVVVYAFATGMLALLAGTTVHALAPAPYDGEGPALSLLGIGLVALSIIVAHPLDVLHTFGTESTGGRNYDRRRRWTRLKAYSILLNLLIVLAGSVLAAALLSRIGVLRLNVQTEAVQRLVDAVALGTSLALGAAYYNALRTPLERSSTGLTPLLRGLALAGSFAAAAVATLVAMQPLDIGSLHLRPADAPFMLLTAVAALGVGVVSGRSLPTIYALFTEERDYYKGRSYVTRQRSVVLPTTMAFALLFLVVLLAVVFQLGVVGLVQEIPRNSLLLGVFGLIAAALIAAVWASFALSRGEERVSLYRVKRTAEERRVLLIFIVSGTLCAALLAMAAALFVGVPFPRLGLDPNRWIDVFAVAVLTITGPYGFYYAARARRIKRLEERFPDFLRDIAAGRKAGLTLEAAVTVASRGEYGELTPEIQKMADQLSWNVPFQEALDRFADRVDTPLVRRAVTVIREASRTGGHVTDVLHAAASDARELKNLETERRGTMGLYTIIVYITFFVFLFVVGVLYGTFIPKLLEAANAAAGEHVGGITFAAVSQNSFRVFYYMGAIVQAVGNGFLAGVLGQGHARAGLRHAFALVATSLITFTLVL